MLIELIEQKVENIENNINRFLDLLQRLTDAAEALAANSSKVLHMAAENEEQNATSKPAPLADDREALLRECLERGITIPPRTRTETIRKKLAKSMEENDAAVSEPSLNNEESPSDVDKLSSGPALTAEDVSDVMRKYAMVDSGKSMDERVGVCRDLLRKYSANTALELAEEHRAAVVETVKGLISQEGK